MGPASIASSLAIRCEAYTVADPRRPLQQSHNMRPDRQLPPIPKGSPAPPWERWCEQNKSHDIRTTGYEIAEGLQHTGID